MQVAKWGVNNVQSYRIKHGYPLLIVKNESCKVSYKCENCEWYMPYEIVKKTLC